MTITLKAIHPGMGYGQEFISLAEFDSPGGAGLGAGRLIALAHPVEAEPALSRCSPRRLVMNRIEGASHNAVSTADANVLVNNYDIPLMRDSTGGTHRFTASIGAVHALMLAEMPLDLPVITELVELNPSPSACRQLGGVLVGALIVGFLRQVVVPRLAGDLASAARCTLAEIN
jgi:hypothetical protein